MWEYNEEFFTSKNRKNICPGCGKPAKILSIREDDVIADEYPEYKEIIIKADDDLEGQATLTGVALCDECRIYGINCYS